MSWRPLLGKQPWAMRCRKAHSDHLAEYRLDPSGDPPRNIHCPSLTRGLLTTRHSYPKNGNTSSLSLLKSSPQPQCRQHLCSPAPHSLLVFSVNFYLPQVDSLISQLSIWSSPHIQGPSSSISFRHHSGYRA